MWGIFQSFYHLCVLLKALNDHQPQQSGQFLQDFEPAIEKQMGLGDEVAKVLVIIYLFEQMTIRFAGTFLLFSTVVNYYIISNDLNLAIHQAIRHQIVLLECMGCRWLDVIFGVLDMLNPRNMIHVCECSPH